MEEKLKGLLEQVPDSYDDFSLAIAQFCNTDDRRQAMIDFLEKNQEATTSDVIEFFFNELEPVEG